MVVERWGLRYKMVGCCIDGKGLMGLARVTMAESETTCSVEGINGLI